MLPRLAVARLDCHATEYGSEEARQLGYIRVWRQVGIRAASDMITTRRIGLVCGTIDSIARGAARWTGPDRMERAATAHHLEEVGADCWLNDGSSISSER
jgi:hypothetical protein